jgi:autotransporter translocation and assembly factor TamB
LKSWPIRILVVGAVAAVLGLLVFVFGGHIVRAAVAAGGHMAGYEIGYDQLANRSGHLTIERPDVRSLGGEPVFTAARIDVAYSLRDVFGGPYLYGVSALEIDRPKLTFIRHADGTTNIRLPANNQTTASKPFSIPQVHVIVKDGSLGILDDTRIFAHSRRLTIEDFQLDANLEPKGRSLLTLGLAVLEQGGKFPLSGRATLDEKRGYEITRIRAKTLALAPLFDYALNTPTLHAANGVLNDVDARVYGLLGTDGTMRRHISITANLDHFQPYLNGIVKPLRDGRGSLRVYDDGLAMPKIDGSIAGVPVRISGAIYNLGAPRIRLGISGKGDLRKLITLSDSAKKFPLSGPVAFQLFVEGDALAPTTLATFSSARIHYARIPIDQPSGLVALHGQDTTILRSGLRYDGMRVGARGRVISTKHTDVDLLATVAAQASRVPYAAQLLGGMLVYGTVVTSGVDANLLTTGVIAGSTPSQTLAGAFQVNGLGVGSIGPFTIEGPGPRRLFARVALDRPHAAGGAVFVSAQAFHISTDGPQPALPGIALARLPSADGTIDADVVGVLAGKQYDFGGRAHAYGVHALGYPIDDLTAQAAISDGMRVAVRARYRGALAPIAAASGSKLSAGGRVDIPLFVLANGTTHALVQITGATFDRANIAGVSLDALDATVGLRGKAVDVYAARARLGGRDIVARGSFGNGGTLEVSASGIDLAALRGAGLPVRTGTVAAVASIGGTANAPSLRGGIAATGVTLPNPQFAGISVDANSDLTFNGDTLGLGDALVRAGPAVASLDGRVSGLRGNPQAARYTFDARVREADIATLARAVKAPLQYPEGTLNADIRVAGSGTSPHVAGNIAIPEGSLNGLGFRDAGVAIGGSANDLRASGGHVTIGTSVIGFDAAASAGLQTFALRAPRIDLADLDDYFDQGDTLGGHGSVEARFQNEPNRLVTSGRVRLAHTRFHRFDIGTTQADWSTTGRRIDTDLALGSTAGRVSANGNLTLPVTQPLRNTFARSTIALDGSARGVDLSTWLPAAGITAPVVGIVDANARVRGVYPNVALNAHASLSNGMVERVAIRQAALDMRAAGGRATITNAVLAIDNMTANASGFIGFRPSDPVDLRLTAQTGDIGALAKTLTGKSIDASGRFTTALRVTGNATNPVLADTSDADAVRYERFTLPHAHAEAALTRTRATLRTAEFDLTGGRLLASGTVPLQTAPTAAVADNAPLALELTADHVNLAQFAALLPKGTQASGVLNGTVGLVGTRANPGLRGTLALSGGSFVGPQLKSPLTNGVAEIAFAGRSVTLQQASVTAGGGTISANGNVTVPDLRDPAQSASVNLAVVSHYAVLDAPAYLKGRINGTVSIVRAPHSEALVAGNLEFTSTRIPPTALLPSGGASPAAVQSPLPVAFNLHVNVGDDVRVQGGPIDVGAKGQLVVGGTLAAPTIAGRLVSTGGTISLYHTFQLQYPSVITFDPSSGVIPDVDAIATTTVESPETDVTMHVTGPATNLNVALSSDPNYSREQILGLLVGVQALGAVGGLQPGTTGPRQNPVQALAEGQLGGLLTQNILEPFSSQLGSAIGLSNLAINYAPGQGASVGVQKRLLKDVNAVFAESFNYPQRESIGLRATPNKATAVQLTFFSQPSSNRFDSFEGAQSLQSTNESVSDAEPANGSSGFALSFQRTFP